MSAALSSALGSVAAFTRTRTSRYPLRRYSAAIRSTSAASRTDVAAVFAPNRLDDSRAGLIAIASASSSAPIAWLPVNSTVRTARVAPWSIR